MNAERRRELRRARAIRLAIGAVLVTVPGAAGTGAGLALLLDWPRRRAAARPADRGPALAAAVAVAGAGYLALGLAEAFAGSGGRTLAALGAAVVGSGAVVALATLLRRSVDLEAARVVAAVGVWALPDLAATARVPAVAVVGALPLVTLGWAVVLDDLRRTGHAGRAAGGRSARRAATALELTEWTDRRP